MTRRRFTLDGRLGALTVRGAKLKGDVAEAVTRASLDLSVTEIPQLSLTIHDPRLELLESRLFTAGTPTTAGSPVDYAGLKYECRAVTVNEDSLSITARDLAAYKLKRSRLPIVRRNMSRTTALALDAAAVGLRFVGEPSARVPSLARERGEDAWTASGRWAQELGFLRFVSAGTLYFGRVSWLIARADATPGGRRRIVWNADPAKADPELIARPVCRRSGDDDRGDAQITAKIVGRTGDLYSPGNVANLLGVPTFDGLYLIDKVRFDLDDYSPVTVDGSTARNLVPQPPQVPTPSGGTRAPQSTPVAGEPRIRAEDGTTVPASFYRGSAAAMVSYALSQAGDRYIFGAEANLSDRDPDAFDCSELVEWACARAGVRFVDGSSNQIARCRAIPVSQGIRTRGALLHRPGHIAISLGNGQTIEAKGRAYGVLKSTAAGRFSRAGLIPGLRY